MTRFRLWWKRINSDHGDGTDHQWVDVAPGWYEKCSVCKDTNTYCAPRID